jgi:hypothetical protein
MSRKALEMEHLSLYRGAVRGTWRESSCTENSLRQVMEGSRNKSVCLIVLHKGNLRHFAKEGYANMLLDWNLYLIYFPVMYNLGVCGLIFDHNTLSDISLWAQQAKPRGY